MSDQFVPLSLPFASSPREGMEACFANISLEVEHKYLAARDSVTEALARALTPPLPAESWAVWYEKDVLPLLGDSSASGTSDSKTNLLFRVPERNTELRIGSEFQLRKPPSTETGRVDGSYWEFIYGPNETISDIREVETIVDWLTPRDFYDAPPSDWKSVVAERIEVWRRSALRLALKCKTDRSLLDARQPFWHGLYHPSKLIKACLIGGPPPEREVSVHHGELGGQCATRLRQVAFTPNEKQLNVRFAFGIDDDRILIDTDPQESSIYLRRNGGPPILLCCSDPWNPPMIFTIDGSESHFRGFAEWLSRAIVRQGLDQELKDDEDEEDDDGSAVLLSRWLLFGDADRREDVLDWRLEAGMVSETRYVDVNFLSFSDETRALASGPGRDAYYAFIRERIDPTFEPSLQKKKDFYSLLFT
jgi:hypothetical protein